MPDALCAGQRKPAHLAVAGLWLEAHHADEYEVEDRREDDRAKDCFCVVRHYVLHCEKEPGACHAPGIYLEAELRLR